MTNPNPWKIAVSPESTITQEAADLAATMMNASKEDVHGALQLLGGIRRKQLRDWTTEIDDALEAERIAEEEDGADYTYEEYPS
jgi:hypothetical protein